MHMMDLELIQPFNDLIAALDGGLDLSNLARMRSILDALASTTLQDANRPQPVQHQLAQAVLYEFSPQKPDAKMSEQTLPAMLWFHGGGYVMGHAWHDHQLCQYFSDAVGCRVFSCEYPLAPENPYPAALLAAAQAFEYLQKNAIALRIDRLRIAVGGASAGAGLAASLCLYVRDHLSADQAQPCFQWLMYPMLDANNIQLESAAPTTPPLLWTRACNRIAWRALMGEASVKQHDLGNKLPPYYSPSLVEDLSGLPSAFLAVGSIDLFHEECCRYVQRLQQAKVPVEFHAFADAPHAFDAFAPQAGVSKRFESLRLAALRQAFQR
jgi:acetyl esterase/lipase